MKTNELLRVPRKYAETLDFVVDDHEEVVNIRAGHEPVVIISLDD